MYTFIIAMMVSFAVSSQTIIDISAIDAAYTTTVDNDLVIDVLTTSSPVATPLLSYDNPFKGLEFTDAEISFDVNNHMGTDSIKVLGSMFAIFDEELGRMYMSNGSYLGFNDGQFIDANLIDFALGTDFIGGKTWKNVKLKFSAQGFAMYVDDVLAFDQNSTDVTIASDVADYNQIITFLQNASTLVFGTGSWWSDNSREDGTFWDAQYSYLKNISFTTSNAPTTAVSDFVADLKVISKEYYMLSGAKVSNDFNALVPGIYILRTTYDNGAVKGSKVVRDIQ